MATLLTQLYGKDDKQHTIEYEVGDAEGRQRITALENRNPIGASTWKTYKAAIDNSIDSLNSAVGGKQATLVSGTNIKTINNQSLLGSGDITIEATGGTDDYNDLKNKPILNGETIEGNMVLNIPAKTSQLANDSGFLTQHQSLNGYATESWVQSQGYLTEHQDISGKVNGDGITKVKKITQAAYDALSTKDPNTLYVIVGAA